jgi:hypothetical protein
MDKDYQVRNLLKILAEECQMSDSANQNAGNIDFVITWVDSTDPEWIADKAQYADTNVNNTNNVRYRNWDTLRYWFRGVEQYAPWVHKVFFITYGHLPRWLNVSNPKLKIVKHSDYIPEKYLPTFNSRVIENHMHLISGLGDQFVYFNDDIFIIRKTLPTDFFKQGKPCDSFVLNALTGDWGGITDIQCHDVAVINKYFDKRDVLRKHWKKIFHPYNRGHNLRSIALLPWKHFTGFMDFHTAQSLLKSSVQTIWSMEPDLLELSSKDRFRENTGVNHWVFRYWQLVTGQFVPRDIRFSKFYYLQDDNREMIYDIRRNKHIKLICINDNDKIKNIENAYTQQIEMFRNMFPEKSSFESE